MTAAVLFPGQGLQFAGCLLPYLRRFGAPVQHVIDEVAAVLPIPVHKALIDPEFEGDIVATEFAQPMTLAASVAAFKTLPPTEITHVAGHSLGEYSALVAAGSLSLEQALSLVYQRGLAMKQAGEGQNGGMRLLLRPKAVAAAEFAQKIASQCTDGAQIASYNSPDQVLVSGENAALDEVVKGLKTEFKRLVVKPLAVSAAFHSVYMQPATPTLQHLINNTKMNWPPKYVFVSNQTARPVQSEQELKQLLPTALTQPIKWTESMQYLDTKGKLDRGVPNM